MMPTSQRPSLESQVLELQEENRLLRERLAEIERRQAVAADVRKRVMKGGFRVLLPLLDRQRVARSFMQLAQTVSLLAGDRSQWPSTDKVLLDARDFMESCVRFAIRRRMLFLMFTLMAAAVPAIQIWLVYQQNQIMENQNALTEIQMYDVVARSMTEGDRNAKLMSGALLANAKLDFLSNVAEEAFGAELLDVYRAEGVHASKARLEDAAFRSHIIRAVVRGMEQRFDDGRMSARDVHKVARPIFRQILEDGSTRMPMVLNIGRQSDVIDDTMAEQVDNYFAQMGDLLQVYGRLARAVRREREYYEDIRPLIKRLSDRTPDEQSRFDPVYRAVMQDFLYDLSLGQKLGDPYVDIGSRGTSPEQAITDGLTQLRTGVGAKAANWPSFEQQVKLQ